MKFVSFPNLNLNIKISSIALNIFGINIYWYAIIIVFAIIIATIFLKKDDGKYGIKFDNIFELMLIVIPISIICARLYYCLFKLDYFLKNPLDIFNLKTGGLAIYGGMIGGIITIIIYSTAKKINILDILDYISPYIALGQAIGRWGNFVNVEAYGTKTNSFLKMGIIESNEYIEVHPCFLYESIITFCLFLILYKIKDKRKFKGEIVSIYLIIYSFSRIFIEALRIDSLTFYGFRISQIVSIIIFIFSLIFILKNNKKVFKKNTK